MTEKRREQIHQYNKDTYEWCKARGICTRCRTEPAEKGGTLCWRCKANESDRSKIRYFWRVENGICPQCGKNKPVRGMVLCHDCNEKNKRQAKALIEERKRNGKCTRCGKKLPQGSSKHDCQFCRTQKAEWLRLWRADRKCVA